MVWSGKGSLEIGGRRRLSLEIEGGGGGRGRGSKRQVKVEVQLEGSLQRLEGGGGFRVQKRNEVVGTLHQKSEDEI